MPTSLLALCAALQLLALAAVWRLGRRLRRLDEAAQRLADALRRIEQAAQRLADDVARTEAAAIAAQQVQTKLAEFVLGQGFDKMAAALAELLTADRRGPRPRHAATDPAAGDTDDVPF